MQQIEVMEKEFKEGVVAFLADVERDKTPYHYNMVMEWEEIIQQNASWYRGWDFAHKTKLYNVVMQELNAHQVWILMKAPPIPQQTTGEE